MAGEFIPFAPAVRSKLSAAAGAAPSQFAPVVSAPATVSSAASSQHPAALDTAAHSHRQASVDIQRDGDRISRITIQCRCGEVIALDCEY